MVRSMTAAGAVPHFHLMDELVLTRLVDLRAALKADPAMAGGRLTFLPFVMKARTLTMQVASACDGTRRACVLSYDVSKAGHTEKRWC